MVTGMEKPYVVGMDIGGTNTVFGIVDSRGNVLATDSVKTQSFSKIEDYVEAVSSKLRPLIESFGGGEKIKGMGVGAPNGNYYNGTIEFAPNLPWKGVIPLATLFEEAIGVPTALTNDANAAAIGEMTYGAARGMKDFIMITLGTGVGSFSTSIKYIQTPKTTIPIVSPNKRISFFSNLSNRFSFVLLGFLFSTSLSVCSNARATSCIPSVTRFSQRS